MSKIKLAVIFGGDSSEHEISRISATSILENISQEKYEIVKIGITKSGNWFLYEGDISKIKDGTWENDPSCKTAFISPDKSTGGIVVFDKEKTRIIKTDVIFPVLHGKNGEDGTVQGLFKLSGIPYVGCNTLASAACMDKAVTHTLLSANNIDQTHYLWFYSDRYINCPSGAEIIKNKIKARLEFPIYVKPANAGSSIGISRVENISQLDEAVKKASLEDEKIVIEEGIDGQEVECAVLGNRNAEASVVGEIVSHNAFYDYENKYVNGTTELVIPAKIDDKTAETIRQTAIKAYRLLGCRGLSRVDFFVRKSDKKVLLNEINTLPGFTSISMYPKLWEKSGIKYEDLIDKLIELAFLESRKN